MALSSVTLSNASAQETLVVDVDVFGLNTNQSTARQQLTGACEGAGDGSAAAQDLQATCDLIADLDESDPDDARRLQELLDAVAPEEAFSVNDSIVYTSGYQVTNVRARLDALRGASLGGADGNAFAQARARTLFTGGHPVAAPPPNGAGAASDDLASPLGVFVTGQVSGGDVDGSTFEQDADIGSSNITAGIDYRLSDGVIVGLGIGALQDTTEFSNVGGSTESEGFNLTAFASWYRDALGYLDLVLDYGSKEHELERGIGTDPATRVLALGSTDSTALSLTASGGRGFAVGAWELGGYFRLSLTRASVDAYTERASGEGAGFGSVFAVDSQSVDSTNLVLGGEISRAVSTSAAVLVPLLRLEYETESEDEKERLATVLATSEVAGSYRGTDRDTGYANLGIGASAVFRRGASAYAFYETRLSHEYVTQNWLKIGLRFEF